MEYFQAKYELCKYLGNKFIIDFEHNTVSYKGISAEIKGLSTSTAKTVGKKIAQEILKKYLKENYNLEAEEKMGSYTLTVLGSTIEVEDFIKEHYLNIKIPLYAN